MNEGYIYFVNRSTNEIISELPKDLHWTQQQKYNMVVRVDEESKYDHSEYEWIFQSFENGCLIFIFDTEGYVF